jgi:hypothetical protein
MGSVVLNGATSGSTTIQPTDAVTVTITTPSSGGTLQTSGSGYTANGVAYASSTTTLTTGSALSFDGTYLSTTGAYKKTNSAVAIQSALWGVVQNSVGANNGTAFTLGVDTITNYGQFQIAFDNLLNGTASSMRWLVNNNSSTNEAMRLDSSGNLGLGVIPSGWGSSSAISPAYITKYNGNALWSPNANETILTNNAYYTGASWIYNGSFAATQYSQLAGVHRWFNAPSGTAGNAVSFTQAMTLDNSGNLLLYTTDTGTSTGNGIKLLVGGAPAVAIVANYSSSTQHFELYNINATNNGYRFYVNTNGGISNYSANNVNLSDQTIKKDIAPAKDYLSILSQIPVKTFLFNDQSDTDLNLGIIAQDVQAVAPELVGTMDIGTKENPNVKLAIYETDLKYAMLKAIQELNTLVTTQAETITSMQATITALQTKVGA